MSRPALALAVMLLAAGTARAVGFGSSAKGTAAADFLQLGAGARAAAMGEAYTAVADETTALYWNPAAMTRLEGRSAVFMHAPYVDSSHFDYLAYAQRLGERDAWGASLQYFSAGGIAETDETGTEIGTFSPRDFAFSAGYAYRVEEGLLPAFLNGYSFGLSLKYVRAAVRTAANTAAADLGLLSPAYLDGRLRAAFTITNMGGDLKFEEKYEDLPLAFRFGGALQISERWNAGLDFGLPKNNGPYAALGTEYILPVAKSINLAGRAGINSRTIGDVDGFTGFSMGFGLLHDRYGFDYAFVPFGSLSLTHRISISCRF
ncbi:MAG: PorV/PorQ family protein [Elusimicrobiota bacterium]